MYKNTQQYLARKLKHRIKFLKNIAINELEKEDWQVEFTVYADIQAVCDTKFIAIENFSFGHVMTEGLFLIRTRFIPITTKMRILFNKREFEIKRIINFSEQNKWLQIIALEII